MRRLLPIVLVVALAAAGCGSSSKSTSSSSSPSTSPAISSELSYVDPGSPFVLTLSTNPTAGSVKSGNQLVGQIPLATLGEQALFSKLTQIGISYQTDIKPLLGQPLMLAIDTPNPTGISANNFLIVWQTASATKLAALVAKLPSSQSHGTVDGAKEYSLGSLYYAVDGAMLVLSGNQADLETGLAHHARNAGFSSSEYSQFMSGLPQGALIQAFGDLHAVLSTAKAAKARAVPWVGAIRGYGVTLNAASGSGLTMQFRIDTGGKTLTASQLPIAAGTAAPPLAGSLPISVGLADPGESLTFIENTLKLTSPGQLAKLHADGLADLNGLIGQLTGNLSVSSDTKTTLARATLSDPTKAATELANIVKLGKAPRPTSIGGGFYQDSKVTIGIAGNQLVLGRATVAQLKAFAAAPSTPAPGAKGSVAFRIALTTLLHDLGKSPSGLGATLLSLAGDITGYAQSDPAALTGAATLALK